MWGWIAKKIAFALLPHVIFAIRESLSGLQVIPIKRSDGVLEFVTLPARIHSCGHVHASYAYDTSKDVTLCQDCYRKESE
jgi:hypothetical protein